MIEFEELSLRHQEEADAEEIKRWVERLKWLGIKVEK
jgi:hypothetical protein